MVAKIFINYIGTRKRVIHFFVGRIERTTAKNYRGFLVQWNR